MSCVEPQSDKARNKRDENGLLQVISHSSESSGLDFDPIVEEDENEADKDDNILSAALFPTGSATIISSLDRPPKALVGWSESHETYCQVVLNGKDALIICIPGTDDQSCSDPPASEARSEYLSLCVSCSEKESQGEIEEEEREGSISDVTTTESTCGSQVHQKSLSNTTERRDASKKKVAGHLRGRSDASASTLVTLGESLSNFDIPSPSDDFNAAATLSSLYDQTLFTGNFIRKMMTMNSENAPNEKGCGDKAVINEDPSPTDASASLLLWATSWRSFVERNDDAVILNSSNEINQHLMGDESKTSEQSGAEQQQLHRYEALKKMACFAKCGLMGCVDSKGNKRVHYEICASDSCD